MSSSSENRGRTYLSRRDFLKVGGLSLLTAADAVIGVNSVINKFAQVDSLLNWGSEVGPELRRQKVIEATSGGVLEQFLKFDALILYSRLNHLPLAENTLKRFLYGNGDKFDVTESITQSIRNEPGTLRIDQNNLVSKTDTELLTSFSQSFLNTAMTNPNSSGRRLNLDVWPKDLDRSRSGELPINISGSGQGPNRDFSYGLGVFTFSFSGGITQLEKETEAYSGWTTSVTGGKVLLEDIYDWSSNDFFKVSLNGAAIVGIFNKLSGKTGIEDPDIWLRRNLGKERYDELTRGSFVTVDNMDGLALQNSGVGNTFSIGSNFSVNNLSINIPAHVF